MTDDLVHKKHLTSVYQTGAARSICGRRGYVASLWSKVTCEACLAKRQRRTRPKRASRL